MKKLLGLDPVYLELKEVGLIGPCFAYFSTFLLKKYVKTITHISGTT
jgi:hypothetical protein